MKKPLRQWECAGGCGKSQMTRKRPVEKCDFIGCGKCDGWRRLQAEPVPEGMIHSMHFNVLSGFCGFATRVATEEEKKAMARARWIRDAAIGVAAPGTRTLQ